MSDLVNYEGVCRTAPATPGLLISVSEVDKIHVSDLVISKEDT